MASEKKIHELIEKQELPEKQAIWNKIQEKVGQENSLDVKHDSVVVHDRGNAAALAWRKKALWFILGVIILLFVTLILCLTLLKGNEMNDKRYCSEGDYTVNKSDLTIRDYGIANNIELLFFNWYEDTEFCQDKIYELNDSNEIICIRESLMDMNTGYIVTLAFTDERTEMDIFESYATACLNNATICGTEVKWGIGEYASQAKFVHKGYNYFLEVDDAIETELLISYIEILLS